MAGSKVGACVLTLGLTLMTLPAGAEVRLSFGLYTRAKPTAMVEMHRPILNVLESQMSQELGEPVRIKIQMAKSYEDGIADLVAGRVDFAQLGAISYMH